MRKFGWVIWFGLFACGATELGSERGFFEQEIWSDVSQRRRGGCSHRLERRKGIWKTCEEGFWIRLERETCCDLLEEKELENRERQRKRVKKDREEGENLFLRYSSPHQLSLQQWLQQGR
jgi:hypothetical protein